MSTIKDLAGSQPPRAITDNQQTDIDALGFAIALPCIVIIGAIFVRAMSFLLSSLSGLAHI